MADQQSNGLMPYAGVTRCRTAGVAASGGAHRGDGGLSALARTQPLAAPHTEENPVQLQAQIRSAGLAVLEWKCRFLSLLNRDSRGNAGRCSTPAKQLGRTASPEVSDPREGCCGAAQGFGNSWGTR